MRLVFLLCVLLQISWTIARLIFAKNVEPCPKNMAHFTDDRNQSTTFCDCLETFLYHPESDSCYEAYRQGPCPSEQYLVLPPGELVAKCEKNPCLLDGLVPFQDECYFLWESKAPCEEEFHRLTVNNITFEIECNDVLYIGDSSSLKISKSCSENSMLVPVNENQTKWICDCKPGFLRDAVNNSCYEAYRQGPCPPEHFFILPPGKKEASCEKNSCLEDGLVPFKEGCHRLLQRGAPCHSLYYYLGVDRENFQLKCFYSSRARPSHHGGGIINAPLKACPPGSRRVLISCKRIFQ